jgi:hypothetical protein
MAFAGLNNSVCGGWNWTVMRDTRIPQELPAVPVHPGGPTMVVMGQGLWREGSTGRIGDFIVFNSFPDH